MKSGEHVVIHQRFIDTKALTSHLTPISWLRHHRKGARTAVQSRPRGLQVDRISRCPDEWKLIHLWKRTQDNLPRPSCLQSWVNIQNYKLKARYWKSWKQVPTDGFRCNTIPALSITSWNHGVGSKWKQLTLLTLCHKTSMRHASQVDHSHCSVLEFSDHFDKTYVRRWMFPFDICSFLPHLKSLLVTRCLSFRLENEVSTPLKSGVGCGSWYSSCCSDRSNLTVRQVPSATAVFITEKCQGGPWGNDKEPRGCVGCKCPVCLDVG